MHSSWKTRVINSFGDKSDMYDQHSFVQKSIAQTLSLELPEKECPDILEIGCGTGVFTQFLVSKYPEARLHVTDISEQMLRDAQKSFSRPNIEWDVMDGEAPQSDRQYDLIVGNMVFQWFENPELALKNLKRFLKPSGLILFSVPAAESFPEWRASITELSLPNGFLKPASWPSIFKSQNVVAEYGSTLNFLRSLKKTGANIPHIQYKSMSASDLRKACRLNDQKYGGQATWCIFYGRIEKG